MTQELDLLEPGRFFYHYTTWHAASEHILPTGRLRLSPYELMNDPLEAQPPSIGAGVTLPSGDDELLSLAGLKHVEVQEAVARIRRHSKLLSLAVDSPWATEIKGSDRRFGMGWARAPMWQHYADNHRGVCLIFDRRLLTDMIALQAVGRGSILPGPVVYSKTGLSAEYRLPCMFRGRGETTTG